MSSDKDMREVTHMCRYPGKEDYLVVGGFNGELKIFDRRNLTSKPLHAVKVIDGGLWRIAPKRFKSGSVLFAIATCSENCFLVLDDQKNFEATTRVCSSEHSWAYGIDWCSKEDSNLLLGCSFYDRSTFLFSANQ